MAPHVDPATTPATTRRPAAPNDAEAEADNADWPRWLPSHDGTQPIMDQLLTETGGRL